MVGSSVLLGAAFVALGILVSTLVRDRGTAAGIAVGVWLLLVLLYDMGAARRCWSPTRASTSPAGRWTRCCCSTRPTPTACSTWPGWPMCGCCRAWRRSAARAACRRPCCSPRSLAWALLPLAAAAALFSRREL